MLRTQRDWHSLAKRLPEKDWQISKEELAEVNITEDGRKEYLPVFVDDIKYLHLSVKDKKSNIDLFIESFIEDAQQETLPELLKKCRLVKTDKVPGSTDVWAFALHSKSVKEKHADLTSREFARMVEALGGVRSHDTNLLQPGSEERQITRHNRVNWKCCLVPYNLMSAKTWCSLCDLFEQPELLQLVDHETPSGNTGVLSEASSQAASQPLTPLDSTRLDRVNR